MSLIEVIIMAIALGTDAFSVAVVIGVQQFRPAVIFRSGGVIAIFHIMMPLFGLYGGNFVKNIIEQYILTNTNLDYIFDLIGAGILMLIGMYMIVENYLESEEEICKFNLEGWGLLVLAVSVSIDAFSVGISLGMMEFTLSLILIFGIVAGIMMSSGLFLGSKIGHWLGEDAQIWGGLALIYLGVHFSGLI